MLINLEKENIILQAPDNKFIIENQPGVSDYVEIVFRHNLSIEFEFPIAINLKLSFLENGNIFKEEMKEVHLFQNKIYFPFYFEEYCNKFKKYSFEISATASFTETFSGNSVFIQVEGIIFLRLLLLAPIPHLLYIPPGAPCGSKLKLKIEPPDSYRYWNNFSKAKCNFVKFSDGKGVNIIQAIEKKTAIMPDLEWKLFQLSVSFDGRNWSNEKQVWATGSNADMLCFPEIL